MVIDRSWVSSWLAGDGEGMGTGGGKGKGFGRKAGAGKRIKACRVGVGAEPWRSTVLKEHGVHAKRDSVL